jgi:hypothetical protein
LEFFRRDFVAEYWDNYNLIQVDNNKYGQGRIDFHGWDGDPALTILGLDLVTDK